MPLFNVQDNLPSIYPNESRDFQLLCKLYDCINNGVMGDIKSMTSVTFTKECRDDVLRLLSTKLGFFPDIDISDESLRYILMAFPEIMKYKGSKAGIEGVLNVFTKINHLAYPIDYSLEGIGYTKRDSYGTSLTINDVVSSTLNISVEIPDGFEQAIESMKIDVTFNGMQIHSDINLPIVKVDGTYYASVSGLWCGTIEEDTVIGVNYKVDEKYHGGTYTVEETAIYDSTGYSVSDSIVRISTSLDSLFVCSKFKEAVGIGTDTSKKWSSYLDPNSDLLVCVGNGYTYEFMGGYAYFIYAPMDWLPSGYTIPAYLIGHTKYGTDIQGKAVDSVVVSAANYIEVELTFVGVNLCLGPDQTATLTTSTVKGVDVCTTEGMGKSYFIGKTSPPYGTRYEYTENIPVNYGNVIIESQFANTITYSKQIGPSRFETTNVAGLQYRPEFPIYGVAINMKNKPSEGGFNYRYDARCVLGEKQSGESDVEWIEGYWGPALGVGNDITLTDTENKTNYFKEFKVRGIRFVGGETTSDYSDVDNAYTTFEYLLTDCGADDTINPNLKGKDLFDYSAFKVFSQNQQGEVVSEQSDTLYVSKWYSANRRYEEKVCINARHIDDISRRSYDYTTSFDGNLPDSSDPVCTFNESESARYVSSITNYFVFRYLSILYLLTYRGVNGDMTLYGVYRSFNGSVYNYTKEYMGSGIEALVAYRDVNDKKIHYGFAYPNNGGVLSFVDVLSVAGEKRISNIYTKSPSVFFGDDKAQSVYFGTEPGEGAFGLCSFYNKRRNKSSSKLLAYGSSLVSVTYAECLPNSSRYYVAGQYLLSLIVYRFNKNT